MANEGYSVQTELKITTWETDKIGSFLVYSILILILTKGSWTQHAFECGQQHQPALRHKNLSTAHILQKLRNDESNFILFFF